MARFYAVFDPDYTLGGATSEKVYIGGVAGTKSELSASAAVLRNGLLESRSILSNQMYGQMDAANIDGSKGIIIPYDVITRSGGNFQFSNVYTSSISGVVIPAQYSTRPSDAFISSSDPRLYATGDSGSILDGYYASASSALNNILVNKIQAAVGNTTNYGPFSAQSVACSGKTIQKLLSIYHDEDLEYFEWNTYYVGNVTALSPGGPFTGINSKPRNQDLEWTITLTPSNIADAYGYVFWEIAKLIGPIPATTTYNLKHKTGTALVGTGAGRRWDVSGSAAFEIKIPSGTLAAGDYYINLFGYFQDDTYPNDCGSPCATQALDSSNPCYYERLNTNVPPAAIAWLTMT